MNQLTLTASDRKLSTKGFLNTARKNGNIPAVLYGGKETLKITVNLKELNTILRTGINSNSAIFNIMVNSDNNAVRLEKKAMIKEMQYHPVSHKLLHVDLFEVSMDKKIMVKIPIHTVGEDLCVKKTGGIVTHLLRDLNISCLPLDIPKEISIDVSNLEIGHAIHVKDIQGIDTAKIKIMTPLEITVVTVKLAKFEEEKPAEAAAPGAEGTAAAGATAAEGAAKDAKAAPAKDAKAAPGKDAKPAASAKEGKAKK